MPGLASVSTGTAEVVEVALAAPVVSRPLFDGNISVYRHVVPGLYLAMTLNHSGGLVLRWFRDDFCEPEVQRASGDRAATPTTSCWRRRRRGPTGLLVLPHFAGSRHAHLRHRGAGAPILGLTFATTRGDLARAILEGLTYELRLNLDLLQAGRCAASTSCAPSAAAPARGCWLQLKADITGIPVVTPRVTEAAALGAALLAGRGRRALSLRGGGGRALPAADADLHAGAGPACRVHSPVRALPRGLPGRRSHQPPAV